jgi:hypothetical protein
MGIGVVVRDERGGFVAAMTKVIPFIFDSTSAEAVAVWDKKKKKGQVGILPTLLVYGCWITQELDIYSQINTI